MLIHIFLPSGLNYWIKKAKQVWNNTRMTTTSPFCGCTTPLRTLNGGYDKTVLFWKTNLSFVGREEGWISNSLWGNANIFLFYNPRPLNLQLRRQFSIRITMLALVKNDLQQHMCEEDIQREGQLEAFVLTKRLHLRTLSQHAGSMKRSPTFHLKVQLCNFALNIQTALQSAFRKNIQPFGK